MFAIAETKLVHPGILDANGLAHCGRILALANDMERLEVQRIREIGANIETVDVVNHLLILVVEGDVEHGIAVSHSHRHLKQ